MRAAFSFVCCCVASSDWPSDSTLLLTSPTESRTKPLVAHALPLTAITHTTTTHFAASRMSDPFRVGRLLHSVSAARTHEQSWLPNAQRERVPAGLATRLERDDVLMMQLAQEPLNGEQDAGRVV